MSSLHLHIGQTLTVTTERDGQPYAVPGQIRAVHPLQIVTNENLELTRGQSVMLIQHEGYDLHRGVGKVVEIGRSGTRTAFELEDVQWTSTNRRRSERRFVNLPVVIRAVSDDEEVAHMEGVMGRFADLSETGGWIDAANGLPEGTLAVWSADIHGSRVRGLGLVARSREGGMGLEFIEFFGGSYGALKSYLEAEAA